MFIGKIDTKLIVQTINCNEEEIQKIIAYMESVIYSQYHQGGEDDY